MQSFGERANALEKFHAAIDLYRRHGAGQPWIDRVEADKRLTQNTGRKPESEKLSAAPAETAGEDAVFRNEGDFWTVAYRGMTSRLRDVKGLRYLGYLLAHPGEQIHVNQLVMVIEGGAGAEISTALSPTSVAAATLEIAGDLGDAGPALDLRAQAEYRHRLGELRAELEEAERFNDVGRVEGMRGEIEFLNAELSASAGIGGRPRRIAAHLERARVAVGKNIHGAVEKIRQRNPQLGHYLSACIKTGYFCAYLPDPDRKISWRL
jgi:hypothetical protein